MCCNVDIQAILQQYFKLDLKLAKAAHRNQRVEEMKQYLTV